MSDNDPGIEENNYPKFRYRCQMEISMDEGDILNMEC